MREREGICRASSKHRENVRDLQELYPEAAEQQLGAAAVQVPGGHSPQVFDKDAALRLHATNKAELCEYVSVGARLQEGIPHERKVEASRTAPSS